MKFVKTVVLYICLYIAFILTVVLYSFFKYKSFCHVSFDSFLIASAVFAAMSLENERRKRKKRRDL